MLKSIDVLIGLTVIMLALSMAVTVITQFVISVINSRGAHLKRGLTDLLAQLDPELKGRSPDARHRQYLQFLAQNGLITIARNPSQWIERSGLVRHLCERFDIPPRLPSAAQRLGWSF